MEYSTSRQVYSQLSWREESETKGFYCLIESKWQKPRKNVASVSNLKKKLPRRAESILIFFKFYREAEATTRVAQVSLQSVGLLRGRRGG